MSDAIRDLRRLRAGYESGALTPSAIVRAVDERIRRADRDETWIHRESLEALLERAAQLERERAERAGADLPPLWGVPFAVKDNIDVAGRPTTAGCPAFAYVPESHAPVVARLLDAGAIHVGKTNMDQFATGLVGTRSPHGACRNVFDPAYIAGGSSSGSGVAVAAGLATFALGTDTAGSGRVPAAFGGIVGLKPTRGLLSTRGVVAACRTLDCVSIFAADAAGAYAVARVAAGFDRDDPNSRRLDDALETCFPETFCFGVPADDQLDFDGDDQAAALFRQAVARLEAIGGRRVTVDYQPFERAARLLYGGAWVAERYAAVGAFIESRPELIDPTVRGIILRGKAIPAAEAFADLYRLERLRRQTQTTWETVDCLLLPTTPTIYTLEQVRADPIGRNARLGRYTNFVNLLDLCAVAVPAGCRPVGGLPFGISLIAPAARDGALCRLAERFRMESWASATDPAASPPVRAADHAD